MDRQVLLTIAATAYPVVVLNAMVRFDEILFSLKKEHSSRKKGIFINFVFYKLELLTKWRLFFILVWQCMKRGWDKKCIHHIHGILLPKLFWPTVRKNCCSDRGKLLKFETECRERSIQFLKHNDFLSCFWRFLRSI